jgi:amidase
MSILELPLTYKTFCLTEIFFGEALVRAKKLDEHLAETGKAVGPLHGLPISLKVSFLDLHCFS